MVINIASNGGRSYVLDMARELDKLGHTVRFYSYIPSRRAIRFGLKTECNYSLFYLALPFIAIMRLCEIAKAPNCRRYVYYLYKRIFDYVTAWLMKPCDVFIGQSPMHVYSLKYARRKFGAIAILERGTSYVLEQAKILDKNPALHGRPSMPVRYLEYDLRGYIEADYITVGAKHVKDSFLKYNFSEDKIFVNNYGFDGSHFGPTRLTKDPYDILIVGQWSYRKGADLLIEACKTRRYRLLHVGSIVDVHFPCIQNMTHVDPVPQWELKKYYEQARTFVLPSREEGLALVQAQAVASGLPLVCSEKTGGSDLKRYLDSDKWIVEMKHIDVDELVKCIERALTLSRSQSGLRSYAVAGFKEISWEGHGRRLHEFLNTLSASRKG